MELAITEAPYPQFIALIYALPRLLAMFSIIPMLSKQTLPGLLRIGVAGCIAILLVPILSEPAMASERSAITVLAIVLKEAMIGFFIGFIAAIPLWAFESMGALIDMQRGASMAEALNPLTGHEASPLGQMFSQASVTFMFATGGFTALLSIVYDSYQIWPVFHWWPHFSEAAPDIMLGQLDRLIRLAVLWGSPVICIMFLSEIGLAVVSRFAPQLQVFFLAMPIKSALGIFTLAVYGTTLLGYADDEIRNFGTDILTNLNAVMK
ncbi:MAG TPA: type III secretion system export apparatus subunit SctT [Burkholderiaceae bacterium]|jgi:type III secretion protein T|nr:type III secretion system export apparatus subunit SctT [Burkholderiaceae bacterium]